MRLLLIPLIFLIVQCGSKERKKTYYEDGTLHMDIEVDQNGVWDGKLTEYFGNGKIKAVMEWSSGVKQGPYIEYYENGKVAFTCSYSAGKMVGKGSLYDANGSLREVREYDSTGNLIDFVVYKANGSRDFDKLRPIIFLETLSPKVGDTLTFFAKLGNADSAIYSQGVLEISTPLKLGLDSSYFVYSSNNRGFRWSMVAVDAGNRVLNARLIFKIATDSGGIQSVYEMVYPYTVAK